MNKTDKSEISNICNFSRKITLPNKVEIISPIPNFIMNALNNGWKIHKENNLYIFTKKHENKRDVFMDSYLEDFIQENNI